MKDKGTLGVALVSTALLIHTGLGFLLLGYNMASQISVQMLTEGFLQAIQFYFMGWLIVLGFQRFTVPVGIFIIFFPLGL